MPLKADGMRIDPPPSVPTARGARPAATAAPAPPDEPPQVFSRFQGFRLTPVTGLSVTPLKPNSGVVVLPTRMAPAALSFETDGASSSGTYVSRMREPNIVRTPRV